MDLPGIKPTKPAKKPADTSGALRLVTLDDLDGRTKAAQEARQMRSAIIRDLTGGDDETALSTLRITLVESVCVSSAIITDAQVRWLKGDNVNLQEITTLTNARRRDMQLLGLDRVQRDVTDLDAYFQREAV